MEKVISYNKLSKKKQKQINAQKRGSWNGVNPVSKVIESKKVYNRKKIQKQFPEGIDSVSFIMPLRLPWTK